MAEFFSSFWVQLVLKLVVAATIIPVVGMVIGFAEMKLSAKMQSRVGPYFAGGRWGWAQLIADGVKFFQKEDLIPAEADRPVYKWAPALVLVSAVAILVPIPLGPVGGRPQPRPRRLLCSGRLFDLNHRHPHGRLVVGQQVLADGGPAGGRPADRL